MKQEYSQEIINIAKKYHKWVEWSDEDKCYVGICPNLFGGGCDGDDEVKVYKELLNIIHDNIFTELRDNTPLPDPINYH